MIPFYLECCAFSGERIPVRRKVRVLASGAVEVWDPMRGRGWTTDHSLTEAQKARCRAHVAERHAAVSEAGFVEQANAAYPSAVVTR